MVILTGGVRSARAQEPADTAGNPMHWSSDKTVWDRKTGKVLLTGHGVVRQPGEVLTADEIAIDLKGRKIDARGSCRYVSPDTRIEGDEMHFDLDTRTGVILGGRVSSDRFTLTGGRIEKLGARQFRTERGAYTTCRDCPGSWTLTANDVDLEFDGYAHMKNVIAKISDAPVLWMPYLIVPLKTRRQSGLLFPKFGFTIDGFRFVQPYFWAISRNMDATIGLGRYGGRGVRAESEFRYRLSGLSGGQFNFYFLKDTIFENYVRNIAQYNALDTLPTRTRWALDVAQIQELPGGLTQKLRIRESSDNRYPDQVGDIAGTGEAYISSDLVLSGASDHVSSHVQVKRTRNLLNPDPRNFDAGLVQVYPSATVTTNDRLLFGSRLAAGMTVGMTRFDRAGPGYDQDLFILAPSSTSPFRPGLDPIRKTTRVAFSPRIYTALRPWDIFHFVPSAEYSGYHYDFQDNIPGLTRGYVKLRMDLSTQLERIYETDDPSAPRIKHVIRPMLSYSRIPWVNESGSVAGVKHPFLRQMDYARTNGFSGYNFDNFDVVPLDSSRTSTNYFLPEGDALSYGFSTQLIRRRESAGEVHYQNSAELKAGQAFNFRELRKSTEDREPLSRFFSALNFEFDRWNAQNAYTYVPYAPIGPGLDRHLLSSSLSFVVDRSMHQQILAFDRSLGVGYSRSALTSRTSNLTGNVTWSLNDYVMPRLALSRDFISGRWLALDSSLRFQSPSRCWSLEFAASRRVCDRSPGFCFDFGIDLALNLTGSGFGGLGSLGPGAR